MRDPGSALDAAVQLFSAVQRILLEHTRSVCYDRSAPMPCFLILAIVFFPRVVLALMWFFSTYLQRAFHGGLLIPLLGFFFLPLTTIVYAWEINNHLPTVGINLLWLLLAVIFDLGGLGGGAHRQSQR